MQGALAWLPQQAPSMRHNQPTAHKPTAMNRRIRRRISQRRFVGLSASNQCLVRRPAGGARAGARDFHEPGSPPASPPRRKHCCRGGTASPPALPPTFDRQPTARQRQRGAAAHPGSRRRAGPGTGRTRTWRARRAGGPGRPRSRLRAGGGGKAAGAGSTTGGGGRRGAWGGRAARVADPLPADRPAQRRARRRTRGRAVRKVLGVGAHVQAAVAVVVLARQLRGRGVRTGRGGGRGGAEGSRRCCTVGGMRHVQVPGNGAHGQGQAQLPALAGRQAGKQAGAHAPRASWGACPTAASCAARRGAPPATCAARSPPAPTPPATELSGGRYSDAQRHTCLQLEMRRGWGSSPPTQPAQPRSARPHLAAPLVG